MTTFEDRLLTELRAVVAARPEPAAAPPRRARNRLAVSAAAAAAAAAAIVAATTGGTPSAYAVEQTPTGAVTVHIRSLSDAAGLQRALRAKGVPAVVSYAAHSACAPGPPRPGGEAGKAAPGTTMRSGVRVKGKSGADKGVETGVRVADDGVTFTIDPQGLDSADKVYVTTSGGELSSIGIGISDKDPGPGCPGG